MTGQSYLYIIVYFICWINRVSRAFVGASRRGVDRRDDTHALTADLLIDPGEEAIAGDDHALTDMDSRKILAMQ